jgi:hypothetical protein
MTHGSDPHSKAADAVQEGRPVEAQYVRQGRRGTHVLWILVISLTLAVIAVFAVWAMRSGDLNATEPHNARQATDAGSFQTTPSEALQTPAQDPTAAERGSTPDQQQLPQGTGAVAGDAQAAEQAGGAATTPPQP